MDAVQTLVVTLVCSTIAGLAYAIWTRPLFGRAASRWAVALSFLLLAFGAVYQAGVDAGESAKLPTWLLVCGLVFYAACIVLSFVARALAPRNKPKPANGAERHKARRKR